MFEKTASAQGSVGDIVIHTMPREFYGKEAALLESAAPKPEAKPVPPPVIVTSAPQPPVLSVAPLRKRSRLGIVVTIVVVLLVIAGVAYGAYRLVGVANEQARLAEEEVERLKAEEEAREAAEEEAARLAEEEAANAEPEPGEDTDSDGLTDVEELLYGTNFRDPDSDEDTYLDGNEVYHRYHPLGDAPSTLLDTGTVEVFTDAEYPYSLYYPATWSAALTRDALGVTFKSSRQASISVTWQEKEASSSLDDYLAGEVSAAALKEMKEILTKEGYYGLTSEDDRTAYLDLGDAVVTLVYDLGDKRTIEYLQTFQMMVNSFVAVSLSAETSTP